MALDRPVGPPAGPRRSKMTVRSPRPARWYAAALPWIPAPTTPTSNAATEPRVPARLDVHVEQPDQAEDDQPGRHDVVEDLGEDEDEDPRTQRDEPFQVGAERDVSLGGDERREDRHGLLLLDGGAGIVPPPMERSPVRGVLAPLEPGGPLLQERLHRLPVVLALDRCGLGLRLSLQVVLQGGLEGPPDQRLCEADGKGGRG